MLVDLLVPHHDQDMHALRARVNGLAAISNGTMPGSALLLERLDLVVEEVSAIKGLATSSAVRGNADG